MAIATEPGNSPSVGPPPGAHRERSAAAVRVAVALGLGGLGYRIAMLLAGAPPTNSDEGTMGLAALHIADLRDLPVYFYGQHYMGTIEAYLAAPLLALTGPSVLALRVPLLVLYAAFLVAMWMLARRAYSPWFATFTVGLLALGADRILKNQLIAGGGYPEINPAAAALFVLAMGLATRPRTSRYVLFGLLTGFLLWDDWLVLPYVAAAAAVPLMLKRPTPRGLAALAAGALVGTAPLLVHDLTSPLSRSALATFLGLNTGGLDASWADRLHGGVLFGIPMGTGMCSPGRCEPWQMWWAVAWLALAAVAVVLAWRALRAADDDHQRVRCATSIALVGGGLVSLAMYARSNAAGHTPVESARYLHCLLISTPALLWPLWTLAARLRWPLSASRDASAARSSLPVAWRALSVGAVAVLVAVAGTAGFATASVVRELPRLSAADDRQIGLLDELDRRGVTLVYSEYWTCNYLAFASGERVRCAVIDADLTSGFDRYLPYRAAVATAEEQMFALPTGSAESAAVRDHLTTSRVPFDAVTVSGYDLYQPTHRVDLPRVG